MVPQVNVLTASPRRGLHFVATANPSGREPDAKGVAVRCHSRGKPNVSKKASSALTKLGSPIKKSAPSTPTCRSFTLTSKQEEPLAAKAKVQG